MSFTFRCFEGLTIKKCSCFCKPKFNLCKKKNSDSDSDSDSVSNSNSNSNSNSDIKSKKKPRNKWSAISFELAELIDGEYFETEYIFNHILNKCIQITASEYGFLGEIKPNITTGKKELHTYAITNIAWNSASRDFFKDYIERELIFGNLDTTLYGASVKSKQIFFTNKYDESRNIVPKGHPQINRFISVPCIIKGETKFVIGLCNKRTKYTLAEGKKIQKILDILKVIFIGLTIERDNMITMV